MANRTNEQRNNRWSTLPGPNGILFRLRDIDAADLPCKANEAMREAAARLEHLYEGLARIKRISDGRSPAWHLAYEALTGDPFSFDENGAHIPALEDVTP